jgi:outer membrane lipoprotein-sorting protein
MRKAVAGAILALWLGSSAAADPTTSGDQILKDVVARYEKLHTYADTASIHGRMIGIPYVGTSRTLFVAPGAVMLRMAVNRAEGTFVATADGRLKEWNNNAGWRSIAERSQLFAAAHGASVVVASSTTWISSLLLPADTYTRGLRGLENLHRLDDEKTDGVDCFRLTGTRADERLEVWVDKATLAVRRIDVKSKFQDARIDYQPQLDPPITEGDLEREALLVRGSSA